MSLDLLKKQKGLLGGLVVGGTVILGGLIWSVGGRVSQDSPLDKVQETKITTVGQRINPQEVWVERLESESRLNQKKIDALEKLMMATLKDASSREKPGTLREGRNGKGNPLPLPQPMDVPMDSPMEMPKEVREGSSLLPSPPPVPPVPSAPSSPLSSPQGVRKSVLKLVGHKGQKKAEKKKTIENTIPAGAFAKAVLIGGVDASTSITAQKDPRPVLLRVTDHGNLPRKFQSDLKACHVLASSYGDLSSERVYMRLEKLTCTERLTGEISETQVAGYILGEDGRAGVRGVVADRAGPLLRNSFVAGFVGGMSQFLGAQQQKGIFPLSPFGQTNALDAQHMVGSSAAQGASNALDKYADFYIKRAEQLQPILQVSAGRAVDIVFTQGTEIGDTSVKKTLTKIRQSSRQQALQDLEEKADQGGWLPSIGQ